MILIAYLSRWLAKAAVKSHLDQLSQAEDNTDAPAGAETDRKQSLPPELPMDDSPPGFKVRWWL